MPESVPVVFQLESIEAGRLVVRTTRALEVAPGAYPRRVRMLAGGLVLLNVPLHPLEEYAGTDELEEEDPSADPNAECPSCEHPRFVHHADRGCTWALPPTGVQCACASPDGVR